MLSNTPLQYLSVRLLALVILCGTAACSYNTGYSRSGLNTLGVLPSTPVAPLWLGALTPNTAGTPLRGAAAITPSATPKWSHVLVSIQGGTPGTAYAWHLRAAPCGTPGDDIGPADRFPPIVPGPDGTAAAETSIPTILSATTAYSVVVDSTCAPLAFGSM